MKVRGFLVISPLPGGRQVCLQQINRNDGWVGQNSWVMLVRLVVVFGWDGVPVFVVIFVV